MPLSSFKDIVRNRRSVRAYRPDPVPQQIIRSVLEDAQCAPSNCNTQPWDVHIVSGAARDRLSQALLKAYDENRFSLDFSFSPAEFYGAYADRSQAQGKGYYEALGIGQEDGDGRGATTTRNVTFFDAPHVAMLFVPPFGDGVRVAADVGIYAQTFLLSLVAHGLAGVPQTFLGMFSETVRESLEIDSKSRLLFGISFGYPDDQSPANAFRMARAPFDENVTFHS